MRLAALEIPHDRPVRRWVADEMRYGLLPLTRRVWSVRGLRPICPVHPRYEWAYLYGALEVSGPGQAQFLCCPTVNLESK